MDVYLVPAGDDRYELYCEVAAPAVSGVNKPSTLWSRLGDRFRRLIAEGEADQDREAGDTGPERSRLRRTITRKIAEAVAEQRLLWYLRDATSCRLLYPDDIDAAQAVALARTSFATDYGKHRRWCVIDGVLVAITGPLFFFVPGPNVISWYFMFRAVGHFFAMRGARQGLSGVAWEPVPTLHLRAIRQALTFDDAHREAELESIEAALGLNRLARFVERVSARTT